MKFIQKNNNILEIRVLIKVRNFFPQYLLNPKMLITRWPHQSIWWGNVPYKDERERYRSSVRQWFSDDKVSRVLNISQIIKVQFCIFEFVYLSPSAWWLIYSLSTAVGRLFMSVIDGSLLMALWAIFFNVSLSLNEA